MALGIPDTEETRKEWRKSGLRYEPDLQETLYKDFLSETTNEELSSYTNHRETELQGINVRLVPDNDDIDEEGNPKSTKGWIVYSFLHYRLDKACNVVTRSRSGYGMYEIPRAHYSVSFGDFGKQTRKADGLQSIEVGYNIPWTKANLQKLVKDVGLPKGHPLQCSITTPQGITFSVPTLQDLIKAIDDPKPYLPNDQSLLDKIVRQRMDQISGRPQTRSPTMEEVQEMIIKGQQVQQQQVQPKGEQKK